MCVLAHPDDESLGMGGTLAKYASEGVETYLVTSTRGERGWFGDEKDNPGLEVLDKLREVELLNAAQELGIRDVKFLDYVDGDLDQANPTKATAKIVSHLRRVRPHIVITFDPNGGYGHPDHIAICQFTTAAVLAADPNYSDTSSRTALPNFITWPKGKFNAYESVFGELVMHVDDIARRTTPYAADLRPMTRAALARRGIGSH
jgi:LmbE family N-acetylglucosaminyl deacetylase